MTTTETAARRGGCHGEYTSRVCCFPGCYAHDMAWIHIPRDQMDSDAESVRPDYHTCRSHMPLPEAVHLTLNASDWYCGGFVVRSVRLEPKCTEASCEHAPATHRGGRMPGGAVCDEHTRDGDRPLDESHVVHIVVFDGAEVGHA